MDEGSVSFAQGIQDERRRWRHLHNWLVQKEKELRREKEEQADKARRYCARDQHKLILEILDESPFPNGIMDAVGEAEKG